MVIYILIGLIVLLFLIIGGLFALILKPEWLEKLRLKLRIKTSNSSLYPHNENEDNSTASDINIQIKTDNEESEKLAEIQEKLEVIRLIFGDVHSTGEIKLFSIIDNIKDYLRRIKPTDYFLLENCENLIDRIDTTRPEGEPFPKMNEIALQLLPMQDLLNQYFSSTEIYSKNIQPFYKSALSELSEELKKFRNLKGILENSETTKVYEKAEIKYSFAFYIYLTAFFTAIYAALHFSLYIIQKKKIYIESFGMDTYDYWTIKISAIFIFITVITFLIKQATHYQKKKDEAERTKLELKALPSYLADLEAKDATNLRKDLASKYFGKSNDNSTLNEIGNIIGEQLKNSTEVAKSSAEVIKALTPPKN